VGPGPASLRGWRSSGVSAAGGKGKGMGRSRVGILRIETEERTRGGRGRRGRRGRRGE